jgi:putative membrane protein
LNYLIRHWSFDPLVVMVLLTIGAHEWGLARLQSRSVADRQIQRRRRSVAFYAGLGSLVICVASPLDYWASHYFFVHMIQHLILSFFAPMLLVFSAPWVPLAFALPVRARRRVGRFFLLGPASRILRPVGRVVRHRWFALLSVNIVMVLWHLPVAFDFAERNSFAHVWLMHVSFIVSGVLFWLMINPSRPLRPNATLMFRAGAIISTNVVMFILAMSLSIFSHHNWYSVYDHVPGVTLRPFADQEIGAAILWICGDFWAVPALISVIRRVIDQEGSVSSALDHAMGRPSALTVEEFRTRSPSSVDRDD